VNYGGGDIAWYYARICRVSFLSADEERDLLVKAQAGDTKARHRLISSYLRFVVQQAHKLRHCNIPFADLVQLGNEGLCKAVDKFDVSRDVRFMTFAIWWIRSMMLGEASRQHSLVKIATTQKKRHLVHMLGGARAHAREGTTNEELAQSLNVEPSDIEEMTMRMQPVAPLSEVERKLADQKQSPEDEVIEDDAAVERKRIAACALKRLSERERDIVIARVMTTDDVRPTYQELSERHGLSRERIRQIEMNAIQKMQRVLKAKDVAEVLA
jgi:RNA polymerase sigma-32 factor